ncbi:MULTISPECIES: spondin domain-containing protein [Corallincola]|nr:MULTISPECIES: spondin domain-containing protein [Corallincola]
MTKFLTRLPLAAMIAAGFAVPASAAQLEIKVENLTQGVYFTPLIIAAHPGDVYMYETGMAASAALQAIAEGGDISAMATALDGMPVVSNPAGGLLAPGASIEGVMLDSGDMAYLSLTAMLLPTNDGFVGLDRWMIPSEAGTYTVYLKGYDAGTEANDELVVDGSGMPGVPGIPAAPGGDAGMNGSGVTATQPNSTVHIHPGVLGDTDAEGGVSDLDSRVHRWLNPVAKLTVTVQ